MAFRCVSSKKFLLFFSFFSVFFVYAEHEWALPRLVLTDALVAQIAQEHESREFRRTMKNAAIAGSAIVGVFWLYSVKNHFDKIAIKEMVIAEKERQASILSACDQKKLKKIIDSSKLPEAESQSFFYQGLEYLKNGSWSLSKFVMQNTEEEKQESIKKIIDSSLPVEAESKNMFYQGLEYFKDLSWSCSKFLIQNALTLSLGAIVNQSIGAISAALKNKYKPESILWFLHEQTQLISILSDLKAKAIPYDLHATALSLDAFNTESQVLLKSLSVEIFEHAMIAGQSNSEDYINYLMKELKKKYIRQGAAHDEHFDAVLQTIIYAKRNQLNDQTTTMSSKQDIQELSCLFKQQLESFLAFIIVKSQGRWNNRIESIITQANNTLASIEKSLQADQVDLMKISKADHGMYTSLYLFEKMFIEEITFMQKYCRLD